jgi:hypothetical protein
MQTLAHFSSDVCLFCNNNFKVALCKLVFGCVFLSFTLNGSLIPLQNKISSVLPYTNSMCLSLYFLKEFGSSGLNTSLDYKY